MRRRVRNFSTIPLLIVWRLYITVVTIVAFESLWRTHDRSHHHQPAPPSGYGARVVSIDTLHSLAPTAADPPVSAGGQADDSGGGAESAAGGRSVGVGALAVGSSDPGVLPGRRCRPHHGQRPTGDGAGRTELRAHLATHRPRRAGPTLLLPDCTPLGRRHRRRLRPQSMRRVRGRGRGCSPKVSPSPAAKTSPQS